MTTVFLERLLTDDVTWWAKSGFDSYGNPNFSSPVVIKARWQEGNEITRDSKGDQVVSTAQIWTDREVNVEDYLYLGRSTSATPENNAREVMNFQREKNTRGTKVLYKAMT